MCYVRIFTLWEVKGGQFELKIKERVIKKYDGVWRDL